MSCFHATEGVCVCCQHGNVTHLKSAPSFEIINVKLLCPSMLPGHNPDLPSLSYGSDYRMQIFLEGNCALI